MPVYIYISIYACHVHIRMYVLKIASRMRPWLPVRAHMIACALGIYTIYTYVYICVYMLIRSYVLKIAARMRPWLHVRAHSIACALGIHTHTYLYIYIYMGWPWLVGSIKLLVSFAKETCNFIDPTDRLACS